MIRYLDTSLLVAVLTPEATTERLLAWLDAQEAGSLAISEWVTAELSSALAIKLRAGQIGAEHRADALAAFAMLRGESLAMLPVTAAQFRAAARLVDQHTLGLRAGDALHLAVCADHGASLCTLDRRLAEAGKAIGVKTALV